jgi:hypothetical protein
VVETSVSTTTWTSADTNSEQDLQGSQGTQNSFGTTCGVLISNIHITNTVDINIYIFGSKFVSYVSVLL